MGAAVTIAVAISPLGSIKYFWLCFLLWLSTGLALQHNFLVWSALSATLTLMSWNCQIFKVDCSLWSSPQRQEQLLTQQWLLVCMHTCRTLGHSFIEPVWTVSTDFPWPDSYLRDDCKATWLLVIKRLLGAFSWFFFRWLFFFFFFCNRMTAGE